MSANLSAIFLSIIFFEYQYLKKYKFQKYDLNFTNFFLFFICFLGSVLWFLKFPVFRYGYSYLICFFGLAISMSIRNFRIFNKLNEIKKICSILIIILILGVSVKHSLRIFPNLINNSGIEAWPRIYSNDLINKKRDNIPVYKNGKLLFYKSMVNQCYYSQSPCTNLFGSDFDLNDINMKILYGYKVYYFIKNSGNI